MSKITSAVTIVWAFATHEAVRSRYAEIEPGHFVLGICSAIKSLDELIADMKNKNRFPAEKQEEIINEISGLKQLFKKHGISVSYLKRKWREALGAGTHDSEFGNLHRSPRAVKLFNQLQKLADENNQPRANLFHLSLALLEAELKLFAEVFSRLKVNEVQFRRDLQSNWIKAEAQPQPGAEAYLAQFGRYLNAEAEAGRLAPLVGRKPELRALAETLVQSTKVNAILVGEAGVGKTCVVEGLAQRVVAGSVPEKLHNIKIVELLPASLVAGTIYRGQFEERLLKVIAEAEADPDCVLFIDEIHTLLGAGGGKDSGLDAANILKPALARGKMRCIGATTTSEYRKYFEKDPALSRRFQVIQIQEPMRDEAVAILTQLAKRFEVHYGVEILPAAVAAAVDLSIRYLPDRNLPDKAIELLDQACAHAVIHTLTPISNFSPTSDSVIELDLRTITRDEVIEIIAERCRLPIAALSGDEKQRLLKMEAELAERVVGQDRALATVCNSIRSARAGLKDPKKPIGVFLFVGPTGVGKTELAKALAEFLFHDEERLLRFDMSEYMEKNQVARLIGAPPGYVGYEEEGQLIRAIRSQPFSVVLFDEVEKAHPEILDIFLQIFDEGQLTDAHGTKAMFREAIIILTSNIGSGGGQKPARPLGFVANADGEGKSVPDHVFREALREAVKSQLKPELINRISEIVIFYPLEPKQAQAIIEKIVSRINRRLADQEIKIVLEASAEALLITKGFSEEYGARNLEREMEKLLVQPLGKEIISGGVKPGQVILASADGEQLRFRKQEKKDHSMR